MPYEVLIGEEELKEFYKRDSDYYNSSEWKNISSEHHSELKRKIEDIGSKLKVDCWAHLIKSTPSKLTFKMIMRMSQLLIETNPRLKEFLQKTYSHVFLDEFQDTTSIQFDFLNSCFYGSETILTAVGDDKQRIMLWAGAQMDVFSDYINKYNAQEYGLQMNFRSAPNLVKLQNHLIDKLLGKKDFVKPSSNWEGVQGEANVWVYKDQESETKHLFNEVDSWIKNEKLEPRELCILVKQQSSVYAEEIVNYFNSNGIKTREEDKFQNILSDDLLLFVLHTLILTSSKESMNSKDEALSFLINLSSFSEDQELLKLESKYNGLIQGLSISGLKLPEIVKKIIKFVGVKRIKTHFPQYKEKGQLKQALIDLIAIIDAEQKITGNLFQSVKSIFGEDSIPIMTIHKSKGLEYRTVIFIGLEDNAFWSYKSQPDEDNCAFFVALSRAKERVVFTFSQKRKNKFGTIKQQNFKDIKKVFDELGNSGVVTFKNI